MEFFMSEGRFNGKVALVTGATNGIGRATAVRLASEGAVVACNHRPESSPETVMAMIKETGGTGFPVAADMSAANDVVAMIDKTVERAGRLDYVVSNAAINPFLPWDKTPLGDYDLMMDTNLKGSWVVCIEGAKKMIAAGRGGAIVTISSISAYVGAPGQTAYCAAKAGILMMSKALARDLGKYNIRVNSILPGAIRTNMSKGLFEDEEALRFYTERAALGRVGEANEIASAAAFLLSDDASYITSAELLVDGGLLVNAEYTGPGYE